MTLDVGLERRILLWFRESGAQGVESNRNDLGAASSKIAEALGISQDRVRPVLTELKKAGYIDTTGRLGYSGIWITAITDRGQSFLDEPKSGAAVVAGKSGKPVVFISHISEERDLAIGLKDLIEHAFAEALEVFVASDRRSIPPGGKWLDSITSALRLCEVEIILASPASTKRPWLLFEAGAGWVRDITVISLCHAGMTPAELPAALYSLQALRADEVAAIWMKLASLIGVTVPETDFAPFLAAVAAYRASESPGDVDDREGSLSRDSVLRIVPPAFGSRWSAGTSDGKPCMFASVVLMLTNVGSRPIRIIRARIVDPPVEGGVSTQPQVLRPLETAEAMALFSILVPVPHARADIAVTVVLTDQFGDEHTSGDVLLRAGA